MKRGRPPKKKFFSFFKRTKTEDDCDKKATEDTPSTSSHVGEEMVLGNTQGTPSPLSQSGHEDFTFGPICDIQSDQATDKNASISRQEGEQIVMEIIQSILNSICQRGPREAALKYISEEESNQISTIIASSSTVKVDVIDLQKDRNSSVPQRIAENELSESRREKMTADNASSSTLEIEDVALDAMIENGPYKTCQDKQVNPYGQALRNAKKRATESVSKVVDFLNETKRDERNQNFNLRRLIEDKEKHDRRLEEQRQRDALRRVAEEQEERTRRLKEQRLRDALRRAAEEEEERDHRLEQQRQRYALCRAAEEEEERDQRLEQQRQRDALRRAAEEEEERDHRLKQQRQRDALRRAAEEEEERDHRLEQQRQRDAHRRAAEEEEERDQRLKQQRQRDALRRAAEEEEERDHRLEQQRQRDALRRAAEEEEERDHRLEQQRQRDALRRAAEEEEERDHRLEQQRQRDALCRAAEEEEERTRRLEDQRRRTATNRRDVSHRLQSYKAAASNDVDYRSLGEFNVACIHCGAIHFMEEKVQNRIHFNSFGDCCLHGRIEQPLPQFPNELALLFTHQHPLAKQFHYRIRSICACFSFSSFNVSDDRTFNSKGIYTFTAGGQVYHKMNMTAQPVQNDYEEIERPRYGQMYFIDQENAVTERINEPINQGINQDLMYILEEIMRSQNPFSQAFMMMREVVDENNQRAAAIGIQPPHVHLLFTERAGDDPRRFNAPTYNEVAAVITLNADQSIPENEMVIQEKGKNIITLKNTDSRVEPFTYPLFYPKGTFGYSVGLPLKTPYASRAHMTRLELAQYRLAFRPKIAQALPIEPSLEGLDLRLVHFNAVHFGGRLFQQYVVDTYIRVERDRIQWIKANQKKLLADQYAGVTHFLNKLAEKKNATVSEKVILPSSFPGSTRFYAEHFEDAMAIVRRFGSPDFFITVTCSPTWPELKEAACIELSDGSTVQQLAQERPDIVARVAKLKFDHIVEDIYKRQIFGKSSAYVYTIEFQKRGLPHLHLLVIMSREDKLRSPEEVDTFISAEIPNEDLILRDLVLKWMIHNPCGEQNHDAPCMVNKGGSSKCRFGFPKAFQEHTSIADDKKPGYRRRYDPLLDPNNPDFSHIHAVYRKNSERQKITRDNRHVAPYNGYLLKKYMCHINVEYVGSIRAVKYLYKYIYKGHDCANLKIIENEARIMYNEPETFVEARYISPPEACWRLLGNEIQKKSHSVQRLDIHLPGQYRVANLDQSQEDLADTGLKGSSLEAYFRHNSKLQHEERSGNNVNYCFYWQMPENFRWIGKTSEWVERQRSSNTIGRVHSVNLVAQPELYHLRLLLFHVKNATSFDDLKVVNGNTYSTYKQVCLAKGLTYDDKQWIDGLRESALSKMPRVMRTLFTQIIILGSPENPKRLWEMFQHDLAEDFLREAERAGTSADNALKRAYRIIAYKLNTEATEGRNFQFWVQNYGMDDIDDYENEKNQEVLNVGESETIGHRLYTQLNEKQRQFVDAVTKAMEDQRPFAKCFFLDGPGGTGKTFVYNTLFHIIRGRCLNVKCMAFTGIAAILLPEGRTTHRTFGLKVPLTSDSTSTIKPGSAKAQDLLGVDVFMMDEAPMLPKYGLNCMDQVLRCGGNRSLPFGGKIMIMGGDFRQCLPVQPRANRSELLDLSVKKCYLWRHFQFFTLEKNMRVDIEEDDFAKYLLQLGNGELEKNEESEIELPLDIISNGDIIEEVYGECLANGNFQEMKERAILAPLNKEVDAINEKIIGMIPGNEEIYKSYDSVKDEPDGALKFPPEFLNSIEISDLPPHQLRLKKNVIVMLLRNLDVSEGLCNGTRLIVTDLCKNIIKAKIITGEHSGRDVHIPRITLDSSKSQLGCTLQRHQFPIRPAFAMTVHKSQGQTFQSVGVLLRTPVFMHGMLYVAFSRVKRKSALKVVLPTNAGRRTKNIVWVEIFH